MPFSHHCKFQVGDSLKETLTVNSKSSKSLAEEDPRNEDQWTPAETYLAKQEVSHNNRKG